MSRTRTGFRPARHAWHVGVFCLVLVAGAGQAAPVVPARKTLPGAIAFSIPSQPLANALVAFSRRADREVLYDSALARGRTSTAVEGIFLPIDALNRLLAGTGLVERYADSSSFVVLPEVDGNVPGEVSRTIEGGVIALDTMHVDRPRDYRAYGSLIRTELQRTLERNPRTRSGKIRTQVELWIDASGRVLRAQLSRSTGGTEQDAGVLSVLNGFSVSQPPPPDLPQPVSVSIDIEPL